MPDALFSTTGGPQSPTLMLDDLHAHWCHHCPRHASKTEHDAAVALRDAQRITGHNCALAYDGTQASQVRRTLLAHGSVATARKKLHLLSAVFGAAYLGQLLPDNPFAGAAAGLRREPPHWPPPFSAADRTRLYNAPIFTEQRCTGSLLERSRAWRVLALQFTGAYHADLAALQASNVHGQQPADGSYPYLVLHRNGHRRRLPIHPTLLRLGFLDYATALAPDSLLFPDRNATEAFTHWFRRLLARQGIDTATARLSSFRVDFCVACRDAGLPHHEIACFMGHGTWHPAKFGLRDPLDRMTAALATVRFDGFPL